MRPRRTALSVLYAVDSNYRMNSCMRRNQTHAHFNFQSFYLAVRRALLHMACNPEFIWTMPATLQDWQTQSTAKIVAMADLIRYHLESDGRCPLVNSVTNADDEASAGLTPRAKLHLHNRLVPDASDAIAEAGDPVNDSKPDKIVLYMAFPSTFSVLLPVSFSLIHVLPRCSRSIITNNRF